MDTPCNCLAAAWTINTLRYVTRSSSRAELVKPLHNAHHDLVLETYKLAVPGVSFSIFETKLTLGIRFSS